MKTLNGFLEKIAGLTRTRVERAKDSVSELQLRQIIASGDVTSRNASGDSFSAQLKSGQGIIAEIKRSSPSRGPIALDLNPVEVAREYLANGASAISVLTEPTHFGGELQDLVRVRAAFPTATLLMKDFVLDPYQILQGRAAGADAVLLIVAMLDLKTLTSLHAFAKDLGLSVLMETHDEAEFKTAVDIGAELIGVNNRDLKSLKTDLAVSHRLAKLKTSNTTLVSESGIESRAAVKELRGIGFDGFLIGTALMQDKTPGHSLRALSGS